MGSRREGVEAEEEKEGEEEKGQNKFHVFMHLHIFIVQDTILPKNALIHAYVNKETIFY
jgi:hypothetical protein